MVSATKPAPAVSSVRRSLLEKLPAYMIPSHFVFLDALRVLPTGKVNRRALPAPDRIHPGLDSAYVQPRSQTEGSVAGIWQEVLHLDEVGIHDNFFDLGGHSLAASRVISRVVQKFQLELPVKALFESPTVAEMAAIITRHQNDKAGEAELARMLSEVEAMTEAEAHKQLEKTG